MNIEEAFESIIGQIERGEVIALAMSVCNSNGSREFAFYGDSEEDKSAAVARMYRILGKALH